VDAANVRRVIGWLCTFVVGAVLSGFAFLLLTGRYINEGPVLVRVARAHGLHSGDLFVITGWAGAMIGLVVLATMPRRGAHR
jgi:hypothetical protein